MVRVASESRYMLRTMNSAQKALGPSRVNPSVLGIAAAWKISQSPPRATLRLAQGYRRENGVNIRTNY